MTPYSSSVFTADLGSDRATADTIYIMSELACEGAGSPIVQAAVMQAIRGIPRWAGDRERALAIYNWVKQHVRFVEDETLLQDLTGQVVSNKELLLTPERLLTMDPPSGDCDDFSTLLASMLLAVDIQVSFVTIAADPSIPDRFSHVYVKANLPRGDEVYMDASHGPYMGWESPEQFRKVEWPIYA